MERPKSPFVAVYQTSWPPKGDIYAQTYFAIRRRPEVTELAEDRCKSNTPCASASDNESLAAQRTMVVQTCQRPNTGLRSPRLTKRMSGLADGHWWKKLKAGLHVADSSPSPQHNPLTCCSLPANVEGRITHRLLSPLMAAASLNLPLSCFLHPQIHLRSVLTRRPP